MSMVIHRLVELFPLFSYQNLSLVATNTPNAVSFLGIFCGIFFAFSFLDFKFKAT